MNRVPRLASALLLAVMACTHDRAPADSSAAASAAVPLRDSALSPARAARPRDAAPAAGGPRAGTVTRAVPNVVRPAPRSTGGAPARAITRSAVAATPPIVDSARGDVAPASPPVLAQAPVPLVRAATAVPPTRAPVPYSPGERLVYDVKFSSIDVGDAVMEVVGVENVRGREAMHVRFNVKGGTFLYRVNDRYESWIDTLRLVSLRHWQQIDEGSYERQRRYEIMPEIGTYKENEKPEQPTVKEPLDDGSFFFFLRTIPLEVGKTYSFDRYFKPDRNPVTVTVVRRERISVPAGTFDAIVLHPTIKAKGVFGEGGQAEIWLADDSTRVMLQMKSKLKIGSLNLFLKSIRRGGS